MQQKPAKEVQEEQEEVESYRAQIYESLEDIEKFVPISQKEKNNQVKLNYEKSIDNPKQITSPLDLIKINQKINAYVNNIKQYQFKYLFLKQCQFQTYQNCVKNQQVKYNTVFNLADNSVIIINGCQGVVQFKNQFVKEFYYSPVDKSKENLMKKRTPNSQPASPRMTSKSSNSMEGSLSGSHGIQPLKDECLYLVLENSKIGKLFFEDQQLVQQWTEYYLQRNGYSDNMQNSSSREIQLQFSQKIEDLESNEVTKNKTQ